MKRLLLVFLIACHSTPKDNGGTPGTSTTPVAPDKTFMITEDDTLTVAKSDLITDTLLSVNAPVEWTANSNGTYTYALAASFQALNVGQTQTVTFQYTVTDGTTTSTPGTITVIVSGVDDAPVAGNAEASLVAPQTLDFQWKDHATDVDDATLSLDSVTVSTGMGAVTDSGNGSFHYDPQNAYAGLAFGQTADVVVTYVAKDSQNLKGTGLVTIHLTGADAPPAVSGLTATTDQNTPVAIDLTLASYLDPEMMTASFFDVDTANLRGTLLQSGPTGHYVFTPDASFKPLSPFGPTNSATTAFGFRYKDSGGATSAEASVTITVTGLNDPPTAGTGTLTVNAGAVGATDIASDVSDIDGDPTTASFGFLLFGTYGTGSANGSTLTYMATAQSATALGEGEVGTDLIAYTAQDPHGGSTPGNVSITVIGVNDAPTANNDSDSTNAFAEIDIDVLANDTDPDTHDTKTVTLVSDTAPSGATVSVVNNGSRVHFAPPPSGPTGSFTFTYTIADSHAATSSATVTVTVADGTPAAISAFSLGHSYVAAGGNETIHWTSDNASDCTLSANGTPIANGRNNDVVDHPTVSTDYALHCFNSQTQDDHTLSVTVGPAYFVDGAASSTGDGSSWENAFNNFADATAAAGTGAVQIWAKDGTYAITSPVAVNANNSIYGGFPAGLTGVAGNAGARSPSGTVVDGGGSSALVSVASNVTLDSLVLTHGQTTASTGGAITALGASNVTLRAVRFVNNKVAPFVGFGVSQGGALYALNGSNWTLDHCVFDSNSAAGAPPVFGSATAAEGGAAYFQNVTGVTITDASFTSNHTTGATGGFGFLASTPSAGSAARGGALAARNSTVTCTRCAFSGNFASGGNGAQGAAGGGFSIGGPQPDNGGAGSAGGNAEGGACFFSGTVTLIDTDISGSTVTGGTGGTGGNGVRAGTGGDGGAGGNATGGGIDFETGTLVLQNASIDTCSAHAGGGAGKGVPGPSGTAQGNDAHGGIAYGGGLAISGATATISDTSAITNNTAVGGAGGGSIPGSAAHGGGELSLNSTINDDGTTTLSGNTPNNTEILTGP